MRAILLPATACALLLCAIPLAAASNATPVVSCTVLTGPWDAAGKARSDLEWNATDADGDALSLAIRHPNGTIVLNTTQARGNLSVGTLAMADTQGWTVRASDGNEVATQYCSVRSTSPLATGEGITTTTHSTSTSPATGDAAGTPPASKAPGPGAALALVAGAAAALALVRKRS